MKLISVRVKNYQSIRDSGIIPLDEGLNVLIGENNVGKSAFLRALRLKLLNEPHMVSDAGRRQQLAATEIQAVVRFTGEEIKRAIFARQQVAVGIAPEKGFYSIEDLFALDYLDVPFVVSPNVSGYSNQSPLHPFFDASEYSTRKITTYTPMDDRMVVSPAIYTNENVIEVLWSYWQEHSFFFNAERLTVGSFIAQKNGKLAPDASNLPNVLSYLKEQERRMFDVLVRHVSSIIPSVEYITVPFGENTPLTSEVNVVSSGFEKDSDMTIPLVSSGTGVGQVISILAAVMTSTGSVFIIDEIGSFLHPAALKKLIRLLCTAFPGNQYIISTHSLEALSATDPAHVYLVKKPKHESLFSEMQLDDVEKIREVATDLGFSIADVFGAENIIWLEGDTEELCFPYLCDLFSIRVPKFTLWKAVGSTSKITDKKRDRQLVKDIYAKLTSAFCGANAKMVFAFDREDLSEHKRSSLQESLPIKFLPRKQFECYLLNINAIAEYVNKKSDENHIRLSAADLLDTIRSLPGMTSYSNEQVEDLFLDEHYLANVDAARLIQKIVRKASDDKIDYLKKNDAFMLLSVVQKINPVQLDGLKTYLKDVVSMIY